MTASGASGSISQRLRMRIYNRKFGQAAKALGRANERSKNAGELKAEAGEGGEVVVTFGEPIDKAALWANMQLSFFFAERSSGSRQEAGIGSTTCAQSTRFSSQY